MLEIDALGTFNMSRASFPALKQSGDAAIINISATLHYGATWYQVRGQVSRGARAPPLDMGGAHTKIKLRILY